MWRTGTSKTFLIIFIKHKSAIKRWLSIEVGSLHKCLTYGIADAIREPFTIIIDHCRFHPRLAIGFIWHFVYPVECHTHHYRGSKTEEDGQSGL